MTDDDAAARLDALVRSLGRSVDAELVQTLSAVYSQGPDVFAELGFEVRLSPSLSGHGDELEDEFDWDEIGSFIRAYEQINAESGCLVPSEYLPLACNLDGTSVLLLGLREGRRGRLYENLAEGQSMMDASRHDDFHELGELGELLDLTPDRTHHQRSRD